MKKLLLFLALLLLALPLHAQTPKYDLAFSNQANRASATFLASTSVLTGNTYVFTTTASTVNANPPGIARVCYWLDHATTAAPDHCEAATPYDLQGTFTCAIGSGTCGGPFNTKVLPDGWHTLTQVVTLSAGGTETRTTPFRIYNGSQLTVNAAYDDGSAVAGTVLLQSLTTGNPPATIATLPLATGIASYKLVLQADTVYTLELLRSDGKVLASLPFSLPSILKVDPAALRSAAVNLVFRLTDQTLKLVTPQVSFAF